MKTILLIDDDEDEFLIFSEVLELLSLPLTCVYINDVSEAARWFRNNLADFVFIDMIMPKMNGLELMLELKTLPQASKSKFVFLSTYVDGPLFKRAIELGATTCIQKQDTVADMANVIKVFFDAYDL